MERPFRVFSAGMVRASAWENKREKDGRTFTTVAIRVDKRYRDANGAWRSTHSFTKNDLPLVREVVEAAYRALTLTEREPGANGDAGDTDEPAGD